MPFLRLHDISKSFPGVNALSSVSINISQGEVHAICGENGAGKSTLMNIIAGNIIKDKGQIYLQDSLIEIRSPLQAIEYGISIVHQHLSLSQNLTVAENIFADNQPTNKFGLIDYSTLHAKTQYLLDDFNIGSLQPTTKVSELSSPQKQVVEIVKALAKRPSILILDEPTASLTNKETKELFRVLYQLKESNTAIIYISHRLEELFKIADKVSILKDGFFQGTFNIADIDRHFLIKKMVGREIEQFKNQNFSTDEVLLSTDQLSGQNFSNISIELYKGEIVGFAGLVGAGRTEVARAIFGADKISSGSISINGKKITFHHPQEAIKHGIVYIPEDRSTLSLFLEMSITDNIASIDPSKSLNNVLYDRSESKSLALNSVATFSIETPDIYQKLMNLSGGNQQKVVLAKWLNNQPDIIIIDEPTHGIDVGAKLEIYKILNSMASKGKGILVISSDLPELLGICDRIIVLKNGTISGTLESHEFEEEKILAMASS